MGRACSTYFVKRNACWILAGKQEEKRQVGRPSREWRIILKWNLERIICDDMGWIDLPQGRKQWRASVNAVLNLRVP
jgi:hypothetical protein